MCRIGITGNDIDFEVLLLVLDYFLCIKHLIFNHNIDFETFLKTHSLKNVLVISA